jgi:hypothetical protein
VPPVGIDHSLLDVLLQHGLPLSLVIPITVLVRRDLAPAHV